MKLLCRLLLTALCLSLAPLQAEEVLADRIIAVVNDGVLLQSELETRLTEVRRRYAGSPNALPPAATLRQQILDTLILEKVQLQKAAERGIRISDSELNQAMSQVAQRNNLDLSGFRDAIERQGGSYAQVRDQVRSDMLISRTQQRFVGETIQVTPAEVDQYLRTRVSSELRQEEIRVEHVLIPGDTPDARQKARDISAAVNNQGASLTAAAADFRVQNLGWREPDALPSLVREPARQLAPGSASAPFESANGWHVIMLAEQRGGARQVTEYQVRHILISAAANLSDDASRSLLRDLKTRIENNAASFAELAREYSDDSSASSGGTLGWNPPGVFVPEFAEQIRNTPQDQISAPFQSSFGWHILQITDQRVSNQSSDSLRNQVRNQLFEQKFSEALPRWQQEIRNSAYVAMRGNNE